MSVEHPPATESTHDRTDRRDDHIGAVAARVADWLTTATDDPASETQSLDTQPRRRDMVTPSATRIGYAQKPENEMAPRVRALHEERRAELQGNSDRLEQLDVLRVTQALCNSLDLSSWERDRVLGVVSELDPADLGGHRTISRVALVLAGRVVDAERNAWLGLDDKEWVKSQPPARLRELTDRLQRLAESDEYARLLSACDLTPASVDQLESALERELADHIDDAAFGRCPRNDPALPAFEGTI
ncbi:DNA-directed RNA polymerase subunit epsilon [Halovenus rubra]|uniref:DNA-directed RNA polymerase subunit epsilon n=2 Tax=Halovenus rubra TaxID=869890 RepID=A0ABD5XFI0_9EURY|nr:DNA-directed RNA polymerase subunit epsilon [Halovenus rubra]